MENSNSKKMKKYLTFSLRLLIVLVLLEVGLRVSGCAHIEYQDYLNKKDFDQNSDYKVMILGDSITYGSGTNTSWPRNFEKIINEKSEVKFEVYDRSLNGVNSDGILYNLNDNLVEYKPDIVIVMMGINEKKISTKKSLFGNFAMLHKFRVYKLFVFLTDYLTEKKSKLFESFRLFFDKTPIVDNHISEGITYRQQQQFPQAEEEFKKALEIDPLNREATFQMMLTYADWKIYQPAGVEAFADPFNFDGILLEELKKLDQKAKTYQGKKISDGITEDQIKAMIIFDPLNPKTHAILGKFYFSQERYEEAREVLERSLAIHPTEDAIGGLAHTYLLLRKYEKSEEMFKQFISINPNDSDTYHSLGQLYRQTSRFEEAIKSFEKSYQIQQNGALLMRIADTYYLNLNEYDKAKEIYKRFAKNENYFLEEAHIKLAEIFKKENDYKRAQVVLLNLAKSKPELDEGYVNLGHLYRDLDERDKAEVFFKQAITLNSNRTDAYLGLMELYISGNEISKAEMLLNEIERRFGPEKMARIYLISGNYYMKNNYLKEAEKMFKKGKSIRSNKLSWMTTRNNYLKVYEILNSKGIQLVAVQYPTLNVADLKSYFNGDEDVIFVDNEENFKEILNKEGYDYLFLDNEHGNLGHMTDAGNVLMAENVADTLLGELG